MSQAYFALHLLCPIPKCQPTLGSSLGASPSHLLIGDLQQFKHHGMSTHVPQQPLLLLPALPHWSALLHTQLAKSNQNLRGRSQYQETNLELECGENPEGSRWQWINNLGRGIPPVCHVPDDCMKSSQCEKSVPFRINSISRFQQPVKWVHGSVT